MANSIRDDILPSQVNIDNIKDWNQITNNTIEEIENIDIAFLEEHIQYYQEVINNISSDFIGNLEKYHLIGQLTVPQLKDSSDTFLEGTIYLHQIRV